MTPTVSPSPSHPLYRHCVSPTVSRTASLTASPTFYLHQAKLAAKLAELQAALPPDAPSRAVDERATLLKEHELKVQQAEEVCSALAVALASGDAAAVLAAVR